MAPKSNPPAASAALTKAVRLRRVSVVANTASGSVGLTAPRTVRALLEEFGLDPQIHAAIPGGDSLGDCLDKAFAEKPDLVVVLAGDGTARAAAERAGMHGPLIAPLPGGTMNMLPHAIYGQVKWPAALRATLQDGEVRTLGGGEIDGHAFFVAAILGSPALWADAREAARAREHRKALLRAARALRRAFSGRLRYDLGGGLRGKAEALSLLCPVISAALDDDARALEAAAIDPHDARQAFRLAMHAIADDWRNDPAVDVGQCRHGRVWASGRIPAILDGEPVRLGSGARITYRPKACRVLAPPAEAEAAPEGGLTRLSPLHLLRRPAV